MPLTITAIPAVGWQFDRWDGSVPSTANPLIVPVTSDLNLIAVFAAVPPPVVRAVAVDVLGQGTTDPAPGTYPVADGSLFTVSAIAAAGWEFSGWSGDMLSLDNPLTVTVVSDLRLTANFTQLPPPPPGNFTVNIAVLGLGTTDPLPGQYTLATGTVLTVLATPDAGWEFVRWDGDVTGANPVLVVQVNSDLSIVAIFAEVGPQPAPALPVVTLVIGGLSFLVVISKLFKGRK